MFQNTYQNGTFFDLFDPKAPPEKTKNLFKMGHVQPNNKVFDKDLKTYVFEFNNPNSKISFPKQDKKDLSLIQQFLNIQIFFFPGMSWNIELAVSDLTKTKRRINLSSATYKLQKKTFFVKYPCPLVKEGIWTNFTLDLHSFINAFKGQSYRSLDAVHISGHFKLRRIFTTNAPVESNQEDPQIKPTSFLPKNFYFPPTIDHTTFNIKYEQEIFGEEYYQPTQPSTKNGSKNRSRYQQSSISNTTNLSKKHIKQGYKGEKKFLANTNGAQIKEKKQVTENMSSQKSQFTETKSKTPAKTDKNIRKNNSNKSMAKNKIRSSIQKRTKLQDEKNKIKGKLNPWRTNNKEMHKNSNNQFSSSKIQELRQIQSAQTTLFQTKNNLVGKFNQSKKEGFQRKSDCYSDSDYIELSQKFSTVTDGKFLKNQLASQHINNRVNEQHGEDQIEEHIELQSNSVCESHVKKKVGEELNENPIVESICDSLDNLKVNKGQIDLKESVMRISHYGFGEKVMNKFMQEIQRPYSPPLGDRDHNDKIQQLQKGNDDKQVELIYDPVLNCYYDHKTHTYYELKN